MRRQRFDPGLSLFPFLSVLMCSIGILIVVFAGTALSSLESTEQGYVVTVRDEPPVRPGRRIKREPIYVVCDARGLTVYRSPTQITHFPASEFDDPDTADQIRQMVRTMVGLQKTRWPVLFVKPSGLRYMQPLYEDLRLHDLRVGKFAFSEDSIIECEVIEHWER